jgi:type IV pilus assembly protein PilN
MEQVVDKGYILVNLLPFREKNKKEKITQIGIYWTIFVLLSLGLNFMGYYFISLEKDSQKERNSFIKQEEEKLDKDIKEISALKDNIKNTLDKRKVVERLQLDRGDAVNLLNYLSKNLPDGTSLKQVNQTEDLIRKQDKIIITGITQSNNKISTYMSNLTESGIYVDANIIETKAIQNPNKKPNSKVADDDIYNEFKIYMFINKKQEEETKKTRG